MDIGVKLFVVCLLHIKYTVLTVSGSGHSGFYESCLSCSVTVHLGAYNILIQWSTLDQMLAVGRDDDAGVLIQ